MILNYLCNENKSVLKMYILNKFNMIQDDLHYWMYTAILYFVSYTHILSKYSMDLLSFLPVKPSAAHLSLSLSLCV